MEISCTHCRTKLNVPDEKIPKGRKASLICPKCKQRIHIIPEEDSACAPQSEDSRREGRRREGKRRETGKESTLNAKHTKKIKSQPMTPQYDASDKPFDFLDENAKTALLCISHPHAAELAVKIMNSMQYHIENAGNIQTALTRMKYHLFNVLIIDEDFDINRRGYNKILEYLNELDMTSRRKMVVLLLSKHLRTMDNMASFHLSVNQIMNLGKISGMELLLKRTIKEHEQFYAIFNESLKKTGKAS